MLYEDLHSIGPLIYEINDDKKTATLIKFTRQINQLTIPQTIKYKTQEWTVLLDASFFL